MPCASITKLVFICSALAMLSWYSTERCLADTTKTQDAALTNTIPAQYAQINDAIVKHNVDKIMSYFSDDFTEVKSSGAVVNREEERKDYEQELGKIKTMQLHYSIENCNTTASGIYCDVHFHVDGVGVKRVLFVKVQGNFTNDLVVHDLWVPTQAGWRLKSRQCLPV
jgi:hypothetical protein